ncbi:hypothetical protein E8E12_001584 [Didymella heteroderae]|uniref:YDG domain-containing protein n=1 Tax=Didymella heteroderae TaxID=1769908 RepID=A0A9P4WGW2_9PLEO|nr:hypothetical protein E8E12_001584 [Didymella heteroderae]
MNHTPKEPFQTSKWLLEAARKRSGPSAPSKTLLDAIQQARDHQHEVTRKLREDALKSARDPNALVNWMAEMSKKPPQTHLAQRPKQAPAQAAPEETGNTVDSEELLEDGEIFDNDEMPSPAPAATPTGPAPQPRPAPVISQPVAPSTKRSTPTASRAQRRVGAKGQITKPAQAKKLDDQASSKDKIVCQKPAKTGRPGSSSSTASPMEVDSFQPAAKSSTSGAVRETLNADPVPASSPPDTNSHPFLARLSMPAWYLTVPKRDMDLLERKRPQELAAIDALKACIERCERESSKVRLAKEYNDLRDHVHKAESSLNMDKVRIKKTRILTSAGLPRIFNEQAKFPWDLKADAWHLYEKWMNEDFERDILRGVVTVKGKDRNGDRLDQAYRARHPKDPKQFGDNGAVLGQWWPSQLCAVRDGIHGAAQGGIYGDKEHGAYSIVLSSGGYHDKDYGDSIEYSGTEGSNFNIKASTQSMLTSAERGNHIRVLRSSQLPKSNKYRPDVGLRYDGLYQIKSYKEIDREKQDYLFHLERVPGQQPIRSEGPSKRPTLFEMQEYERCKGRL